MCCEIIRQQYFLSSHFTPLSRLIMITSYFKADTAVPLSVTAFHLNTYRMIGWNVAMWQLTLIVTHCGSACQEKTGAIDTMNWSLPAVLWRKDDPLLSPKCSSGTRVIAFVEDSDVIEKIHNLLALWVIKCRLRPVANVYPSLEGSAIDWGWNSKKSPNVCMATAPGTAFWSWTSVV